MGMEGNAIQQQIPKWMEDILSESAENFAGILEMYLPRREARRVGREIALRNAQQDIANGQVPAGQRRQSPPNLAQAQPPEPAGVPVEQAVQRGAIIKNPERERALAALGAYNPPHQNIPMWGEHVTPLDKALALGTGHLPDAAMREVRDYARSYAARQAAARALPEYIDNPAPQVQNPGQLPSPEPMLGPSEAKEREEKYGNENARIAQAQGAPARHQQAPANGGYPEPPNRLAPIPEEINRAGDLTRAGIGQINPYLQRAEQQSAAGAQEFPQRRQDYMNPYTQDVVNKIREEGMKTLNEGILPSLEAQFIRRGAHGGSRHAGLAARAARDTQGEILARQAQALHSGYGQAAQLFGNDQLRKFQHGQDIRQIGGLQSGSNLADITALMDMGRYKQSHEQHGKDNEYYNYMRKRNEPLELLERQSAMLKGMPAPISQYGYASTPANPQLNTPGQIGSAAAQLLGMTMRRAKGGPIRRRRGGRVR